MFNKLRWFEIIVFLAISISLLSPEFALNKIYPKFNYKDLNQIHSLKLDPNKEVHIRVTRPSEYGERYKLFVINKNSFEKKYTLENYGINLIEDQNRIVVDTIQWNGLAKKNGMEMGDIISELKIENLNRPNKGLVYPFSLGLLLIFGYLNYRNYGFKKN